jgi:hypothetical protein
LLRARRLAAAAIADRAVALGRLGAFSARLRRALDAQGVVKYFVFQSSLGAQVKPKMSQENLIEDLAYVRALAEEGKHAPLLGGAFLVFWGALNTAAYLAHWAIGADFISFAGDADYAALWALYGVTAGVGSFVLSARLNDKPGTSAIGVRAERAIWAATAIGIGAIAVGAIIRMAIERDFLAPNTIPPAALAFCGAALIATAALSGQKWLGGFGVVSMLAALAVGAFANAPGIYLCSAAFSAATLIVPGLVLLRREPAQAA